MIEVIGDRKSMAEIIVSSFAICAVADCAFIAIIAALAY